MQYDIHRKPPAVRKKTFCNLLKFKAQTHRMRFANQKFIMKRLFNEATTTTTKTQILNFIIHLS